MVVFEELESGSSVALRKKGDITKKLIGLASRTGYDIIQTNGQRVYEPKPSRNITPPPRGCEVFIGRLPKHIYEDELIPLFEKIGPLYKFRMMLDFTEKTRGYAFATYFKSEDADRAVSQLNNYEIRPKLCIGVYKSVDNCRLFIGNIPVEKNREEVLSMLQHYAQGIVDLIMFQDYEFKNLNRGFVFVEFENHRFAAMARRQFTPNNLIIWDKALYVDWADPVPVVDSKIMEQVTVLYLSNLPADYNSQDIRACICTEMSAQLVKKVHKHLTYAFVHFSNRTSAEYAYAKLTNFVIDNYKVSVEWARPRCYSKKYRWVNPPENFCTSVPPSLRRLVYHQRNTKLNSSSSTQTSYPPLRSQNTWEDLSSKRSSICSGQSSKNLFDNNYTSTRIDFATQLTETSSSYSSQQMSGGDIDYSARSQGTRPSYPILGQLSVDKNYYPQSGYSFYS